MGYGYIEPWQGYLDESKEFLDFSRPMPGERPEKFEDARKPHERAVKEAQLPRVYFHLDPESLEENFGVRWEEGKTEGVVLAKGTDEEAGEGDIGGGMYIGYEAAAPKPMRLRNFTLRFDDYVKGSTDQDTAESIRLLRRLALPWKDPRALLHWTRFQTMYKELRKYILVKEVTRQEPLPFKISDTPADPVTYIDPVVIARGTSPKQRIVNGPVEIRGGERVLSEVFLPPRPVVMTLPGLLDFVCVIEGLEYEITRLDAEGRIRAATVTLDLVQFTGSTLEEDIPIETIFPNAVTPDTRTEIQYALVTLTSRDNEGKITGRTKVTPLTSVEYANLGE
jgi:hypothetical protein